MSRENHISINKTKSAILQLGSSTRSKRDFKPEKCKSFFGYPCVDSYKYFKIIIDSRINLHLQLKKLATRSTALVNRLKIIYKKNWPLKTWIILYKLYVLPHF
jgi:hypothetical protein